jgi:hypothetical protein
MNMARNVRAHDTGRVRTDAALPPVYHIGAEGVGLGCSNTRSKHSYAE